MLCTFQSLLPLGYRSVRRRCMKSLLEYRTEYQDTRRNEYIPYPDSISPRDIRPRTACHSMRYNPCSRGSLYMYSHRTKDRSVTEPIKAGLS